MSDNKAMLQACKVFLQALAEWFEFSTLGNIIINAASFGAILAMLAWALEVNI